MLLRLASSIARVVLQRRAISRHCLLETRGPALPSAKRRESVAEIHLRHCPLEPHPIARAQSEQVAITLNRRCQGSVVTAFFALLIERISLLIEIAQPNVTTLLWHTLRGIGKMPRRVLVVQL